MDYFAPISFSLDTSGLLASAEDIFNGLNPAFVTVWGLLLGIGLLLVIGSVISKAIKMKG